MISLDCPFKCKENTDLCTGKNKPSLDFVKKMIPKTIWAPEWDYIILWHSLFFKTNGPEKRELYVLWENSLQISRFLGN